jgi:hypothetical protein
MYFYG